jgi:hypothetical protein
MGFFIENVLSDLNSSYNPFLTAAMQSGMDEELLAVINTPLFPANDFMWNTLTNVTYQKQVYLFKELSYRYLNDGESASLDPTYFQNYYSSILFSRTIDGMQKLFGPIDAHFHTGIDQEHSNIALSKVVLCLLIVLVIALMAFLRVRSSRELLGYFRALDNIKEGIAMQRLKEVKYALDEMKKFRGAGKAVEIDQDMGICICIQSHPRER